MRIRTNEPTGNRDLCGRCKTRHGGNNRLCLVHGPVSKGCCVPGCRPEEWEQVQTGQYLDPRTQRFPIFAWRQKSKVTP